MTDQHDVPTPQWGAYLTLAADEATRVSDRFQSAGTYANTVETPDTTDEQWAEAFFNGYHSGAA